MTFVCKTRRSLSCAAAKRPHTVPCRVVKKYAEKLVPCKVSECKSTCSNKCNITFKKVKILKELCRIPTCLPCIPKNPCGCVNRCGSACATSSCTKAASTCSRAAAVTTAATSSCGCGGAPVSAGNHIYL